MVRDKQWKPCFKSVNNQLKNFIRGKREVRYLCFPAEECIFITQLLNSELINKKSQIIGVEKDTAIAYEIRLKLRKWFEEENFKVFPEKFENLITDPEFASFFPFDIANLDFTHCALNIDSASGDIPIIDAIQNFFINQNQSFIINRVRINDFFLLITSRISIEIHPTILKQYGNDRNKVLLEKVIGVFNKFLRNKHLTAFLSKSSFATKDKFLIFVISLCLIVIEQGFRHFYIELKEPPILYKGRKKSVTMVSMKFYCKKQVASRLNGTVKLQKQKTDFLRNGIELAMQTDFLKQPET